MAEKDYEKAHRKLVTGVMSSTPPGTEKEDRIKWEMARYGIPDLYIGGGKIYYERKYLLFDSNGTFFGYCVASIDKAESANSFVACKPADIGIDIS